MTHKQFLTRPSYSEHKSLKELRQLATQGRSGGHYNTTTLWYFRAAWRTSGKLKDLLAYLLFRRDLGYSLPQRYFRLFELLQKKSSLYFLCSGINRTQKRLIFNIYNEAKQYQQAPRVSPSYQNCVDRWTKNQNAWQKSLTITLNTARTIAVVGNSPNLKQQKLGAEIDQHEFVVRFNEYQSDKTSIHDIGKKINLWVMAPGFDKTVPKHVNYVLITGPASLQKQQNWLQLVNLKAPVVDVPLYIWKRLVRIFGAPPSAGILTIAWLRELTKSPIALYGFGFTAEPHNQYHHARPQHQAVMRHNWEAEHHWLRRFNQASASSQG